jgi:hypothetical protein
MLGDSELAEHSQAAFRVSLVMSKNPDTLLPL